MGLNEAAGVAGAALLGAALGLAYDFASALRLATRRAWLAALLDAAFCAAAASALFAFGMAALGGRLRLYALCSCAAGWGAYLLTISAWAREFFSRLVDFWVKAALWLGARLSIIKKIIIFFISLNLKFIFKYSDLISKQS